MGNTTSNGSHKARNKSLSVKPRLKRRPSEKTSTEHVSHPNVHGMVQDSQQFDIRDTREEKSQSSCVSSSLSEEEDEDASQGLVGNLKDGDQIIEDRGVLAKTLRTVNLSEEGIGQVFDWTDGDSSLSCETCAVMIKWECRKEEVSPEKHVYLIGDFDNWNHRLAMSKVHDREYELVINLPAGIHKVQFIVGTEVKVSDSLPKATESSGKIVNWFEVCKEDIHTEVSQDRHDITVMEAGALENKVLHQKTASLGSFKRDECQLTPMSELQKTLSNTDINDNDYTTEIPSLYDPDKLVYPYKNPYDDDLDEHIQTYGFDENDPYKDYNTYLKDLNFAPPPQLPPYLDSSLLNERPGSSKNPHYVHLNSMMTMDKFNTKRPPLKHSDSSTRSITKLNRPNHVILNHLITSNMKNGVLSVSLIHRYSMKFVTQVLYSAIEDD